MYPIRPQTVFVIKYSFRTSPHRPNIMFNQCIQRMKEKETKQYAIVLANNHVLWTVRGQGGMAMSVLLGRNVCATSSENK